MAETNTSNIGFEKQIWDAACVLRGNIDASEYIQNLIFLIIIDNILSIIILSFILHLNKFCLNIFNFFRTVYPLFSEK